MKKPFLDSFQSDNMNNDNYDHFAVTFAKSRKNMAWPELDTILDDIEKHNFTKILDVGCGSARFLEFFYKKNNAFPEFYLGIDNSEKILIEAKKNFPKQNFLHSEMTDFDEKIFQKNFPTSEKFDAIVFLASFHHLENEKQRIAVLQNMRALLAENGKIYMTNWNLRDQERYKKSEKNPGEFYIKISEFVRYYHGFTLSELEKIFLTNGFQVEKNEVFEGGRNFFSIISKK